MEDVCEQGEVIHKNEPALFHTGETWQPSTNDLLRVFEGLGMGIVFIDHGCRITCANTAAVRLLKLEGSRFQGLPLKDLSPACLGRLFEEQAVLALHNKTMVCFDTFKPEDHGARLHCRCLPLSPGAALVLEDGAFRKDEAEARSEYEGGSAQKLQELDAVYAATPMGFCVIDRHLRFVRINDRLADISGAPAAEHIGKTVREIAPSIADKAEAVLRRVLETGAPMFDVEFTGSTLAEPDVKKTIVLQCSPLKDSTGRTSAVSVVVEEVTELEQAYRALAASEERYRILYDSMSQGVVEFDAKGRIVSSNRAAREISGIDIEKLNGVSMAEVFAMIPEACREDGTPFTDDTVPAYLSLATGREAKNTIVRIMAPGRQNYLWVSHDVIPWFEPGQDNPGGMFIIFSDITKLKNIQEPLLLVNEDLERKILDKTAQLRKTIRVLENQKETLERVFNNIPVMLIFYDPSQNVRMVNREFERLTGWSPDDGETRDLMAASFPDPRQRRKVWRFMISAQGIWREFEITTRSGEPLASSWMSLRLSDSSRIGIGIDLSLHKKMGKDLAKFAAAVEQAGDGIALIGANGVIEYINPALEEMTGYTLDEATGMHIRCLTGDLADEEHCEEMCDPVSTLETTWRGRRERKRKNGEAYEASLSVTPVRDKSGRIVNYAAIVRDVTREARLQQQLLHAHKMEALGTLAGGISHDLKNIFTPILLDTEILMQDMGVGHPFYPILDEIHKATRLGLDLVAQIFIFSRNVHREKAPVDLYPVVRQVLSFLRSALPSVIDIDHQLNAKGAFVMANPTQIQQVLMNLGSNAKYAMRKSGGLLTVRLDTVDLNDKEAAELCPDLAPGPYVEIMVKDTGEGMDGSTLRRIFDPFFSTKSKGEGSGMGLAVVHGIVKEHNGAISVWSRPGKGSVFRVLLPRIKGQPPAAKSA